MGEVESRHTGSGTRAGDGDCTVEEKIASEETGGHGNGIRMDRIDDIGAGREVLGVRRA